MNLLTLEQQNNPNQPSYLKKLRATKPIELTSQQQRVLQLMAESNCTKQIAAILKLSPKTIEFHRKEAYNRLGLIMAPEPTALVTRWAVFHGVVSVNHGASSCQLAA